MGNRFPAFICPLKCKKQVLKQYFPILLDKAIRDLYYCVRTVATKGI